MSVRRAAADDVPALAALRAQWHGKEADGAFVAELRGWFDRADRVAWVATPEGELVGMVNLALSGRMPSPGRLPALWGYLANPVRRRGPPRYGADPSTPAPASARPTS